jgi:hypothetical protein
MITEEEVNEKIKEGWLKVWMMFEVLAINEKVTKESLESLINKLDKDIRIKMYKKEFGEIKRVEKPLPNIECGYSLICEIELVSKKFDDLVKIVIEYGPSAIEVLEPSKLNINAGEAQEILTSISQLIHNFAAAGIGGIVFIK